MFDVRPANDDDRERIARLVTEAFVLSNRPPTLSDDLDLRGRYVLTVSGAIEATAWASPVAQWFSGRAVPCAAVRAVSVSSTARNAGHGTRMMEAVLADLRRQRIPLSVLFPSVPSAYRRVGYEPAGLFHQASTRAELLPRSHNSRAEIVEVGLEHEREIAVCYDEACRSSRWNGPIARSEAWWRAGPLSASGPSRYCIAVRESGRFTGYIIFTKEPSGARLDYFHDIFVRDVAWLTAAASDALLGHLAGHRGLAERVVWPTFPGDPWASAIGARAFDTYLAYPFMERLVDARSALEQRGYARGATISLELEITDPSLGDTCLRLDIADGKAAVTDVRSAPIRLDVGAFAALYTGHASARMLARAGRLTGADDTVLDSFDVAFAGCAPFLPELF